MRKNDVNPIGLRTYHRSRIRGWTSLEHLLFMLVISFIIIAGIFVCLLNSHLFMRWEPFFIDIIHYFPSLFLPLSEFTSENYGALIKIRCCFDWFILSHSIAPWSLSCHVFWHLRLVGPPVKRRKWHRRKNFQNQEPCIMRGVYFKNMKWQAAIKVDKKQIHLGTVGSQEEAARLYDR